MSYLDNSFKNTVPYINNKKWFELLSFLLSVMHCIIMTGIMLRLKCCVIKLLRHIFASENPTLSADFLNSRITTPKGKNIMSV
jgi:hypothetical protein